jgi:hypothetical protein
MAKNPKVKVSTDNSKVPKSPLLSDASKVPKTNYAQDAMKMSPSWRLSMVQTVHPWGWHELTQEEAKTIYGRLVEYEGKTWREILVDDNYWNHRMECWKLCKEAKERLEELYLDDLEQLVSLRLTSLERIWGILDHNVFHLLWWDPDHLVYPVEKRNT